MSCEWLTVHQFAEQLGVTSDYVYALIRRGHLEALSMPGTGKRRVIRICLGQVDRYMVNRPRQSSFLEEQA